MKSKLSGAVAASVCALALSMGSARADNFYTTTNDGTGLAVINTANGSATFIGNTGFGGSYGLAFNDLTGTAYGIVNSSTLVTYNLITGAATQIGNLGVFNYDLEISPTGAAYAAAQNGNFYSVNLNTGAATLIGALGSPSAGTCCTMDLAFNSHGTLYGTNDGFLYTINLITGAATQVANFGIGQVMGIAFDHNDTLYATAYQSSGALYTIDTTTGATTFVGATGLYYEHGGDILNPVPGPTIGAGLPGAILALGGLLAWRRRRTVSQFSVA